MVEEEMTLPSVSSRDTIGPITTLLFGFVFNFIVKDVVLPNSLVNRPVSFSKIMLFDESSLGKIQKSRGFFLNLQEVVLMENEIMTVKYIKLLTKVVIFQFSKINFSFLFNI